MLVRKANINDLSCIIDLWYEMMVFHVNVNDIFRLKDNAKSIYQNYIKESMKEQKKTIFVCERRNKVVGYIFVEINSLPPVYCEGEIGVITEIGVNERERKQGIGKLLLDKAEEWIKDQGILRAECIVSIDNYLSQSFWKKNNYTGYNEICYKYL
jgi:ribosomal protein S18 acetylase RimI-like enzyme